LAGAGDAEAIAFSAGTVAADAGTDAPKLLAMMQKSMLLTRPS